MKFYFIVVCFALTISLVSYSQNTLNYRDSILRHDSLLYNKAVKYEFNFSVGMLAFAYGDYSTKLKSGGSLNPITSLNGFEMDILNEVSISGNIIFKSGFGFGLEFGRMTHFEDATNDIGNANNSYRTSSYSLSQFVSGLYLAPSVNYKSGKFGATIMFPYNQSLFIRSDKNYANQHYYSDMEDVYQKAASDRMQPYINVFVRVDLLPHFANDGVSGYIKTGYDLQFPQDNVSSAGPISIVNHKRFFVVFGTFVRLRF